MGCVDHILTAHSCRWRGTLTWAEERVVTLAQQLQLKCWPKLSSFAIRRSFCWSFFPVFLVEKINSVFYISSASQSNDISSQITVSWWFVWVFGFSDGVNMQCYAVAIWGLRTHWLEVFESCMTTWRTKTMLIQVSSNNWRANVKCKHFLSVYFKIDCFIFCPRFQCCSCAWLSLDTLTVHINLRGSKCWRQRGQKGVDGGFLIICALGNFHTSQPWVYRVEQRRQQSWDVTTF